MDDSNSCQRTRCPTVTAEPATRFSCRVGENRPKIRREKEPLHLFADFLDVIEAVLLTIIFVTVAGGPVFMTLISYRRFMEICDKSNCPEHSICLTSPEGAKNCLCVGTRVMIDGLCKDSSLPTSSGTTSELTNVPDPVEEPTKTVRQ